MFEYCVCSIYHMREIYCILNKITEKTYIGQTSNTINRIRKHKESLRRNKHSNAHLQAAWNMYGEAAFEFLLIDCNLDANSCDSIEVLLIKWFKELVLSYNISDGGHFTKFHSQETKDKIASRLSDPLVKERMRISNIGKHHTEETKQKLRNFNIGKKLSPETCQKMSSNRKGHIVSQEQKVKISNTLAKTYCFINPEGQEIIITNLQKYCKENNLCTSHMNQVYYGKRKQHKGWTRIQ